MPKPKVAEPNKRRVFFKEHYLDISGIEKKEVAFLKLPGQKELVNISQHRKRNGVELNYKKVTPFLKAEAKRLGLPLEEYMKNVTIVHTHKQRANKWDPELVYSLAVPWEMDYVSQIGEMLEMGTKKEMTVLIDVETKKPIGYTFVRLNLNREFFKRIFGITVEEYIKERKKELHSDKVYGADLKLESRFTHVLERLAEISQNNGTFKNHEQIILTLAKHLGFRIKFLAEEGYHFDKEINWFKPNSK